MTAARIPELLLVEPEALLRRTVALTARSANLASLTEAASVESAVALLGRRRFDGAVIAVDVDRPEEQGGPLVLLDYLEGTRSSDDAAMPVAVMVERCDAALLGALRAHGVTRIIIKPFRARAVIDAIIEIGKARTA